MISRKQQRKLEEMEIKKQEVELTVNIFIHTIQIYQINTLM